MSVTKYPLPFGKFILLNKIAMGGMAEIFRAKTIGAEGFEKEVVIKRILPHYTEDEAFVTMFIDEAKVSSGLNHPNIVQIFDFDIQDECYFISMEYVEGKDLRRVIDTGKKKNTPLSIEQTVRITMEICKGLHYAHTKTAKGEPLHIVHRDVSPQNVLIGYNGSIKVTDFGIAKAAARSTKTRAGTVKGKCAYMSPEQARGKPLDLRSDMFAVGVMMWEMLTGKRLFAGETDFETLTKVLQTEVEPPSTHNPHVPPEIDQILLGCLKRDCEDRPKDCKTFLRQLEQWFYSTVTDPDAGEISGYMQTLFDGDIMALRELQAKDGETQFLAASETVRQRRSSSSQIKRMATTPPVDLEPSNEAPTIALDLQGGVELPSEDATIALNVTPGAIAAALAEGAASEATMAIPGSSTGVAPVQVTGTHRKSRTGLVFGLITLFIGLGIGGYFAWKHFSKTAQTEPTLPPTATIVFSVEPGTATIRVGALSGVGKLAVTAQSGEVVIATFAGTSYETQTREITVGAKNQNIPVVLKHLLVKVMFSVQPVDAAIRVGAKAGIGSLQVTAKIGDILTAEFSRKDYVSRTKELTVINDGQAAIIVLKKKVVGTIPAGTKVTVKFAVSPSDATIRVGDKSGTGSLEVQAKIGDIVTAEFSREGYVAKSKELTVVNDGQLAKIVLDKKTVGPNLAGTQVHVKFTVTPSDATIEVAGQTGVGKLVIKSRIGDSLDAVFTHPQYKRLVVMDIRVNQDNQSVSKAMIEKKAVLTPKQVTITLKATPADTTITLGKQSGKGTLKVKVKVGDVRSAVFKRNGYITQIKNFTVISGNQTVDCTLVKKPEDTVRQPPAILEITVKPVTALLLINKMEQTPVPNKPGFYRIQGYRIGVDLKLVITAKGFKKIKQEIKLTNAFVKKNYVMTKFVEPKGPGRASFVARPWAWVSVRGKRCKTNCSLRLRAGRHTASFSKPGSPPKRRSFTVRSGKTTRVYVDMRK